MQIKTFQIMAFHFNELCPLLRVFSKFRTGVGVTVNSTPHLAVLNLTQCCTSAVFWQPCSIFLILQKCIKKPKQPIKKFKASRISWRILYKTLIQSPFPQKWPKLLQALNSTHSLNRLIDLIWLEFQLPEWVGTIIGCLLPYNTETVLKLN